MEKEIADICKDLRILGDKELLDMALCAFSSVSGIEHPRVDLSYSYLMRKLRKGDPERRLEFQRVFKDSFEEALEEDLEEPESVALVAAMKVIDFKESEYAD
jgi:hypothetical protein